MTATEDRTSTPPSAEVLSPSPRRRLGSRMSGGHLLMLVAALVAAVLNYALLRAQDDTVRVAVVEAEVQAGSPVTAAALAFTDVRLDGVVLSTLLRPEQLGVYEGHIATTSLAPGELVRLRDLQPPSAPASQRAMSIPIEPEHAVGGRLSPGDRIDIIEVLNGRASYLVTDAEVLHVPTSEARGALGGLQAFSVTVAVDDRTALRLAAAMRGGQLEIVRSTGASMARVTSSETPAHDDPGIGDDEGD